MEFFGIVFLAIIVEGVISYVKTFLVDGKIQWQIVAAIIIGVLVAATYQVDLLALAGLKASVPFIGSLLTGILISRGSNYVFDLIKLIEQLISKEKTP